MSGLDTYLLELGPDNLGEAWAAAVDRQIAASLPVLAIRLRLRDVARLVAEAFRPALSTDPTSAIRIIDIAGGPSETGVRRASASCDARVGRRTRRCGRHHAQTSYDWNDTANLASALCDSDALTVCTSEGGLFEYGSDATITTNLRCLREHGRDDLTVVGSLTRDDAFTQRLRVTSCPATHPRGLEVFRALALDAGWNVARAIERPLSDQVPLTKLS